MINKLKNNFRYCLEYDYFLKSASSVELFDVNGIVCILNRDENYCMVADYCRSELSNIEDIIRKNIGCNTVLINFNVISNMLEEDVKYLNENRYKLNSNYNSYINRNNSISEDNVMFEQHIVELTANNIGCYMYNHCNEKIQYRPSFETLVDVLIRKNGGKIIAYVDENSILGYLSYVNIYEDVNDIDFIYVADQYRNRGIGTLLGKYYATMSQKENKIAFWSNATEASSKVALKSGFEWCCRHISYYKEMDN